MCGRTACKTKEAGDWNPELLIYAAGRHHKDAPPIRMRLGLRVCNACRPGLTAFDFLSEPGKRQIEVALVAQNLVPPDFSKTELGWVRA